ncbi:MAG: manganese catalase family protein [Pseudomonadota bacterium]
MFFHNKRLQYPVRVSETNPGLANLMLEQFGVPQGELAAARRYVTQAVAEDHPSTLSELGSQSEKRAGRGRLLTISQCQ